jgi:hypothetical protein
MIASASDYDGDGDTTEGMYYEIAGLQEKLYAAIETYARKLPAHRSFTILPPTLLLCGRTKMVADTGDNGSAVRYTTWAGRLLMAAYNFRSHQGIPGAFAHGSSMIVQLLFDSITDLNTVISSPVDMSAAVRDDAGALRRQHRGIPPLG